MKKTVPAYITALSNDDMEILEDIFYHKYKKFMELFWLIKDYSDYTKSITYKKTKKDVLKIELVLAHLDTEKVMEEIQSNISKRSDVLIWNNNKIIHIEIKKHESVLP